VTVWQMGDAENAMNYWANGLDQKLVSLGVGQSSSANAGSIVELPVVDDNAAGAGPPARRRLLSSMYASRAGLRRDRKNL
jgi:hypothetical protein